jgi:hypothetical protein
MIQFIIAQNGSLLRSKSVGHSLPAEQFAKHAL